MSNSDWEFVYNVTKIVNDIRRRNKKVAVLSAVFLCLAMMAIVMFMQYW